MQSTIRIAGTSAHFLEPTGQGDPGEGRLRYLTGGTGAPLVLLHTVRTQAEHFRHLIPLVQERYTVYALDLPGMGYSQIVPGASYDEAAMRAGVKRLITQLDLRDVTLLGGRWERCSPSQQRPICPSAFDVSWRSTPTTTPAESRGPASWHG
jgi:pimeloyl-ACP methyl ester carboxylesterase